MKKIDYLILAYCERNETTTAKEISNKLHLDKALVYKSITNLTKLKKLGLIKNTRPSVIYKK